MPVFTPGTLSGLSLWLRSDRGLYTDAGTTPVSADADPVYQWNDFSGNNLHYVQATLASRPLYKTGRLNGYPGLQFDATNDFMTNGFSPVRPYTMYVVFRRRSGTGHQRVLNGTNDWLIGPYNNLMAFYNGHFVVSSGVTSVQDKYYAMSVVDSSAGATAFVNRIEWLTNGAVGTNQPGQLIVGGGGGGAVNDPCNCDIMEVIVYDRKCTRLEMNQLDDYLAVRYGSALFLPYRLIGGVLGCIGHYQANAGITLVSSKVSQWADQSGFDHHLTQATAGSRPTIATADLNGADTMAYATQFLSMPAAIFGNQRQSEIEVFATIKADLDPQLSAGPTGLWHLGSSGASTHYPFTDSNLYEEALRSNRVNAGNLAATLAAWRVWNVKSASGLFAANAHKGYLDNVVVFSGTVGTCTFGSGASAEIGKSVSSNFFAGKWANLTFFNRFLDATEQAAVHAALASGVYPMSLPLTPAVSRPDTHARYC